MSDAESILTFAEIGVVLMLFIIGTELDPKRLWTLRASVFGGGSIQMVGCGPALSAFCYFLGLNWKVALLIGLTLALIHRHRHAGDERTQPDAVADRPQRICGAAVP